MKYPALLILLLASCAHQAQAPDAMKTDVPEEEPKPAIRERIVPGTTYGNAALQMQTIESLEKVQATTIEHSSCSPVQASVVDTWALSEPEPSQFNSAFLRWKELWTLDACNENVDFEVVYMLHKTGIVDVSVSRLQEGEILASD